MVTVSGGTGEEVMLKVPSASTRTEVSAVKEDVAVELLLGW
jgi:hypothetical protein